MLDRAVPAERQCQREPYRACPYSKSLQPTEWLPGKAEQLCRLGCRDVQGTYGPGPAPGLAGTLWENSPRPCEPLSGDQERLHCTEPCSRLWRGPQSMPHSSTSLVATSSLAPGVCTVVSHSVETPEPWLGMRLGQQSLSAAPGWVFSMRGRQRRRSCGFHKIFWSLLTRRGLGEGCGLGGGDSSKWPLSLPHSGE